MRLAKRTRMDRVRDAAFYFCLGFAAIVIAGLLSGCADVVYRTERVEIPVPVPCLEAVPPEPAWPLSDPSLSHQGRREKAEALVRELGLREEYQRELRAVLERCARS